MTKGKTISKWFAVVFFSGFATIGLANFLLNSTHHDEIIPLVTALIVGIHFLPLANIFRITAYYMTGTSISLLAVGALIALLFFKVTLGGLYAWATVVGLGNAVILWITALYVLSIGRRLLRLDLARSSWLLTYLKRANKACSGFLGFCAIYKHFSGFEFFLHLKQNLSPPKIR